MPNTGYIYNPAIPVYSPRMYPPVFPLLLAPVYKMFGLSLLPMKLEQVFFIVLTLALVLMLWHRTLGHGILPGVSSDSRIQSRALVGKREHSF